MAYFWQYFLSSASLPRQPGLVTPPFPLRHLLVYFPVSVSWQWVPSVGHHDGQANLPTAHLSKISLVNGNFPRSIHLKSVFTQSIFWNVCHFTIVKMSACILLEILWSVWSSFWGFQVFSDSNSSIYEFYIMSYAIRQMHPSWCPGLHFAV